MSKKAFIVSIDEIQQNFVFAQPFVESYTHDAMMSDGTVRTIKLTPMIRDGEETIRFDDNGYVTYMGPNGTTTNNTLMVQVREVPDDIRRVMEEKGILD